MVGLFGLLFSLTFYYFLSKFRHLEGIAHLCIHLSSFAAHLLAANLYAVHVKAINKSLQIAVGHI